MKPIDRRTFMSAGLAAGATAALANRNSFKPTGARSPNEAIGIGVIGCGVRGRSIGPAFHQPGRNTVVRAICDPNGRSLSKATAGYSGFGQSVDATQDLRHLLDRKDIDAVLICPPNHWHTLATIWALEAGKDVYVEKPATHNLWEGAQLAAAAERNGRIVQHGVQLRSSPAIQEAVQKLREGAIGKVYMARALVFKPRKSMGRPAALPNPPDYLDWNLWQGPAMRQPFAEKIIDDGNWHFFWKYGGGELANQGIHEVDMALWGLGIERLPDRVMAMGGSFVWNDAKQAPETLTASCRYEAENKLVEISVRNWSSNTEDDVSIGNIFYGTKGVMLVSGYVRYKIMLGSAKDRKAGRWIDTGSPDQFHIDNFLDAVRNQDRSLLHAPIKTALPTCGLAHLCNISFRTGQQVEYNAESKEIVSPPEGKVFAKSDYAPEFEVPTLSP